MAKIKTHRAKHGKLWISVYLQDFGFGWNLGLNIYKSRRAQNDWYNCKRNRRARRAAQTHGLADFRCLAACARLMRLCIPAKGVEKSCCFICCAGASCRRSQAQSGSASIRGDSPSYSSVNAGSTTPLRAHQFTSRVNSPPLIRYSRCISVRTLTSSSLFSFSASRITRWCRKLCSAVSSNNCIGLASLR
jgi:hypothetical protein